MPLPFRVIHKDAGIGDHELKVVAQEFLNYMAAPRIICEALMPSVLHQIEEYGNLMVKAAIDHFGNEEAWKNRTGCFICAADYDSGFPNLVFRVGSPAPEKLFEYWLFSQEKGLRTAFHKHVTSFESADNDRMHYGGAVRVPDLIISCSGFPAHGDEVIVLGVHVLMGSISIADAEAIAKRSNNPYFVVLVKDIEGLMRG